MESKQPFLYDYQMSAVNRMFSGCILAAGVGTGKSRTSLYWYFKENGGSLVYYDEYVPMKSPKDLYIITTAMKRDKKEWDLELVNYSMSTNPQFNYYDNKIVIDSWNNIKKYVDVSDAYFIFDEDRLTGSGAWVKAFYKIAKKNKWIILSATPGDCWKDYTAVFVANGFYRNKTEYEAEHFVYSRFSKYPQVERYVGTGKLIKLRRQLLIDIDFTRKTVPHHENVYCEYDKEMYRQAIKTRWDPFKDEPMRQASNLCYVLRRIVNEDEDRVCKLLEILDKSPKVIIFYNFDYEREMLLHVLSEYTYKGHYLEVAEWSGHSHDEFPKSKYFAYLVQYTAGAEGWNSIKTDTIIFYSQNYSYRTMLQAAGRIDRLNTPYTDLYYYHLKSRSSIDIAISKALSKKKRFNENDFAGEW